MTAAVPAVDAPPETQPIAWRHRHLLDVDALTRAELELVMGTADAMREVLARPIPKVPAMRGTNVTILFYEASTRTRVSFEVAAKNLSCDVVNIAAASSSWSSSSFSRSMRVRITTSAEVWGWVARRMTARTWREDCRRLCELVDRLA